MTGRDGFKVVDGGRADNDPTTQDDEDARAALAEVLGGPQAQVDPATNRRAAALAADIMGLPISPTDPQRDT